MLVVKRLAGRYIAALAILAGGIALSAAGRSSAARTDRGSPSLADFTCDKVEDFTAIMHVAQYNENAGRKINRDFGYIYKLKGDIRISFKEEDRLRLDAHLGPAKAVMIVNGSHQYVRVPALGIRTTTDLGDTPGKRKTLLDVGLISRSYLGIAEGVYLGQRPVDGVICDVFRVQYRNRKFDTSHRDIWIDPNTRVVLKREEYSQEGKLNATYLYQNPVQVSAGVWFPSRVVAINNEGQTAGVTDYKDVKINTGISDELFNA